ncbi:MAG: acyltransferase family protein [Clostridia bacterium]|nr:acyltransferase family protein [Clostridia bacterium]
MERERSAGYDIIRILSIFSVVMIHTLVPYLGNTEIKSAGYVPAMLISSLCLIGAPLFFMLSGAFLLDTSSSVGIGARYFKRITKQLVPFLIWSVIYVIARIAMGKLALSAEAFTSLLYRPAYDQFWFMYVLLLLYLLLPLLQAMLLRLNKRGVEILLLICWLLTTVIPLISWLAGGHLKARPFVDIISFFLYTGYFILGYYLKKYRSDTPSSVAVALICVGAVLTLVSALAEWLAVADFHGILFRDYSLPSLPLLTGGVFILLGKIKSVKSERAMSVISHLGVLTVGVFYIHMLVLKGISLVVGDGSDSLLFAIIICILVTVLSYLLSFVISLIPVAKTLLLGIGTKKREGKRQ